MPLGLAFLLGTATTLGCSAAFGAGWISGGLSTVLIGVGAVVSSASFAALLIANKALAAVGDAVREMPNAMAYYDSNDCLVYGNAAYLEMLSVAPDQVRPGMHYKDIVRRSLPKAIPAEDVAAEVERRYKVHRTSDGTADDRKYANNRWQRVVKVRTSSGGSIGFATDVTELHDTRAALQVQLARFTALANRSPVGLCQLSGDGRISFANPALLSIFGAESRAALMADPSKFQVRGLMLDGLPALLAHLRAERTDGRATVSFGEERHITLHFASFTIRQFHSSETGEIACGETLFVVLDETERVRAEAKVHHLALHDPLTGAANRVAFTRDLLDATEKAGPDAPVSLLAVDLDKFKPVNDAYGHAMGDGLLAAVVRRVRGQLGEHQTLYRMGGDEFAVIAFGMGEPDAVQLATKIVNHLQLPFSVRDVGLSIGASCGVATMSDPQDDVDTLVEHADMALYDAKRAGGGRVVVFSGDDAHGASEKVSPTSEKPGRAVA